MTWEGRVYAQNCPEEPQDPTMLLLRESCLVVLVAVRTLAAGESMRQRPWSVLQRQCNAVYHASWDLTG